MTPPARRLWLDAHLAPELAAWVSQRFGVNGVSIVDLGFQSAKDRDIFEAGRREMAIMMTKDNDFVEMLQRFGPPPQVIHLTCGNTSNTELRLVLERAMPKALALLAAGEPLVEITRE